MLRRVDQGPVLYDLSQRTYNPKKIPVLTHAGKLIPFSKLRKYFNYTEPVYCEYMKTWLNVHPNQYTAGCEIIDCFTNGINNVLLLAEMQSGKTGCTRYVVHALQHLSPPDAGWDVSRFEPERVYFICGMNDNDLRGQAIGEFRGYIPEKNILFSKQLQASNRSPTPPIPGLVIVDESHYASFRSSQVDKFLKRVAHPDLLVLSVSATAMAELAAGLQNGGTQGHIYLRPGEGYYSLRELFSRDLIQQSVDITKDQARFIDLVVAEYDYQREHGDLKFNIVRLPNQWYYKDLEEELHDMDIDIEFINHHTCTGMSVADFNKYICDAPERCTIIWIYGSLRAGKQLDTTHIGFVHDTSASSPDVIAQSLMGRILGYHKYTDYVRCYTDIVSARRILEWISSAYDVMKIPMGSKGILGGYSEAVAESEWALHTPVLVKMDSDMSAHYRALKQRHGDRYPYKVEMFEDLAHSDDTELSSEIFSNYKAGQCGGLMILTEDNQPKSFRDHWEHNYQAWKEGKFVHCCNALTAGKYFYVYVNLHIKSTEYGLALVTYKEHIDVGGDAKRAAVQVKQSSRFYE